MYSYAYVHLSIYKFISENMYESSFLQKNCEAQSAAQSHVGRRKATYMYVYIYVYVYTHTYVYIYINIYIYIRPEGQGPSAKRCKSERRAFCWWLSCSAASEALLAAESARPVWVYVYTYMGVCMCVCVYMYMHIYAYIHVYTYTILLVKVCSAASAAVLAAESAGPVCVSECVYDYTCMYVCVRGYIYMNRYIYIHLCTGSFP